MQYEEKKALSQVRLERAYACLTDAKNLLDKQGYASAANRAYYAVFHAMRAVLALDGVDMKHHSGIISEFRRRYIKTGIFDISYSGIISVLFDARTSSDYDDYYIIEKALVQRHLSDAESFLKAVEAYLADNLMLSRP